MLGTCPALGILAGDIQHLIAGNRATVTAHGRDMREELCTTLLRLNKAEALVVIPVA